MPFNKERVAATYAKEILRVVSGSEIAENAVVDGTTIPLNGDGRRILETGTVMVWTGAIGTSKVKPIPLVARTALQDDVQTITLSATPTAGSFKVTVPGYGTTAAVSAYTAAALQTALQAISGLSDVTVGLTGQVYTLPFPDRDVAPVTFAGTGLVATGTPVTAVVATSQDGVIRTSDIAGVLMHTTEFWPDTTEADKDDAPVALFTKNCHFHSPNLIGFSGNAAVVKSAMTGAGNDRCANCTFQS